MKGTPCEKKTKGRQKIEIKPIEDKSNVQVTFSKRRAGLVKKASEISLLCGAQVAVLAFSPGNKAFSFGYPDVEAVLDRYLNEISDNPNTITTSDESSNDPLVQEWNRECEEALKELEEEKKPKLNVNEGAGGFWWCWDTDDMDLEELEEYSRALHELKRNVTIRANELSTANQFVASSNVCVSGSGDGVESGCVDWCNFGDDVFY